MKINDVLTEVKKTIAKKFSRKTEEKAFDHNGIKLRYQLFKKNSNMLLVIFQGYEEEENRYDSPKTLEGFHASRLYIKNNNTPYGEYHLSVKEGVCEETAVLNLIREAIKRCKAEKLVFIGTEKNGYSAVNFGIEFKGSAMITGAPEYFIGDCMQLGQSGSQKTEEVPYKFDYKKVNYRLQNKIQGNPYADTQSVYIHCSVNEETFRKHVKCLADDLEESGTHVFFDRGWYEDKGELEEYFTAYLKKILKNKLQPKGND